MSRGKTAEKIDFLENIIALMPGHVYWKDKEGKYLGCNDNQACALGLASRKNIIGKTDYDLAWKKQAGAIRENDQEVMQTGQAKVVEERGMLANGKQIVGLSQKVPLRNQTGQIIGILGISIDITDQKRTEEELKKAKENAETANRAKSEFLAVMSHELRTPLNGIMGAAQILSARHPRANQKEFVDDIYRSSNVLLALINDVLDLSKLEAGRLEFISHPCDFKELVEEMVGDLSHLAKEKGLQLLSEYKNNVPRYIITDSRRLKQLLFNLVGNAIKYTEEGHILTKVECLRQTNQKAQFKISVTDTGIGIPRDKLDFVFDRFNQVEPSYCGHYRGTGLGLAIVRQMVENMGGTIHVKSRLNEGSTFWCVLTFPLQDDKSRKIFWPGRYEHARLLMVNDDELEGQALLEQIAKPHEKVISSKDVIQTLAMAQNEARPYEVVIVDDRDGKLDPLSLATQIHKEFEFNKPALFLLTSEHDRQVRNAAKQAGFYKCFLKPIPPTKFVKTIVDALDRRYLELEHQSQKILSGLRILLVEDNAINQKIARVMLEDEGCQVKVAPDGESALKMVKQDYDVIFMDIGLPDIDGYEVTKRIRRQEKEGDRVTIIAMTANAFEQDKQRCLAAGMDAFVSKPVEQRELQELLINKVLKNRD